VVLHTCYYYSLTCDFIFRKPVYPGLPCGSLNKEIRFGTFSGMISQSSAWILSIPSFHLLCAAPQVNGNVVIGC